MTARHSSSRTPRNPTARRVVLFGAFAVAAVVLIGLVAGGLTSFGQARSCKETPTIEVGADPAIIEEVRFLADKAQGQECFSYNVSPKTSADISGAIAAREELPDVWISDSSVRMAQVSQNVQIPFDTVLNSLASTPVVIASRTVPVDMVTWTSALGTKGLAIGDPTQSGTADAPILAGTAEVESLRSTKEALGQSLAALAQGQAGRKGAPPTEEQLLDRLATEGGAAVVSEQQAVRKIRARPEAGLVLGVPNTGAMFLNYPLAVVTQNPERREMSASAATALRKSATVEEFSQRLEENGFRAADRSPLRGGDGVGNTDALVVRDPSRLETALQRWRLLSLPSKALVLLDTSGSMANQVEGTGKSRIQLLLETAAGGLGQFPDNAAIGAWAFGGNAARDGKPYAVLNNVARLDMREGAGTHRDAAKAGLASTPGMVGGGTDLYQTVLDAFDTAQKDYDPNMVNAIIVISDGANDNVSALSKEQFLTALKSKVDPTRPVVIVTIGLMEDADPATLAEIADATGGTSHLARTPGEIGRVFAQAIQNRGAS